MADTRVERLLARREALLEEHRSWQPDWKDIADLILLSRRGFMSQDPPGSKKTERLYDSTAPLAAERLAANLAGVLTSDAFLWFGLKFRLDELNEDEAAGEWLEECARRMYRAFNQSNYSAESKTTYKDLVGLGTDALFLDERKADGPGFGGLHSEALALADYVIGCNYEHKVDTLFRTFTLSAVAAAEKWGFGALGAAAQKALSDGKPDTPIQFAHGVVPRASEKASRGRIVLAREMPWASYWIDLADRKLVSEGGYHEFPYIVTRWDVAAGETYGTGPGHLALPDVKSLNKAREIILKLWSKHLDPPLKALDDGVVGTPDIRPGAITIVRQIDGIQPLYPPGMWAEVTQSNQINQEDLRRSVRAAFFADQLEIPIGPMMTAYEFAKRLEHMERLLGPTLGRVKAEKLTPTVGRLFGLMLRAQAFPPAPESVRRVYRADIDIEYEGPLAKSQRLSEVEAIERLNAIIAAAMQIDPDVVDNADFDAQVQTAGEILGVPKKTMRGAADIARRRADRAEQRQAEKEGEDVERAAIAAGKAAPALALLPGVGGGRGQ